MEYKISVGDKKSVVKRFEELSGEKAKYTRAPRFAYIIRGIVIEKDGTIITEANADMSLIHALTAEGIIEADGPEEEENMSTSTAPEDLEPETTVQDDPEPEEAEEPDEEEEPEEAEETEEPEEAEEPEPDVPDESVEEEADNEASEEPEVEETEAVDATTEADEAVNAVDPGTEEEPAVAVPSEQNDQMVETGQSEPDEHAENTEEDPYGDMVERIEAYRPTISFPLSQHRPESICNLVYTIYSDRKSVV